MLQSYLVICNLYLGRVCSSLCGKLTIYEWMSFSFGIFLKGSGYTFSNKNTITQWLMMMHGMVLMPASIVLGPRWTTARVIHCTVYFHFQLIMNQLVPKLIHLCQENWNRFESFSDLCTMWLSEESDMMLKWMIFENLSGFSNSTTVITENW